MVASPTRLVLIALLSSAALAASALSTVPASAAPVADARWAQAAATALRVPVDDVALQTLEGAVVPGAPVALEVTLDGVARRLELAPHSLRGPDFRVLVQGADGALTPAPAAPSETWRGRVAGSPGSTVVASRVAGEWRMRIVLAIAAAGTPDRWEVAPLDELVPEAPAGLSVVHREAASDPEAGECAVTAGDPGGATVAPATAAQVERLMALSPVEVLVCEIACDADSDYYALNGKSVPNTVADIEAVLDAASHIYELDTQMTLQLGTVIVRTAPFPRYATTNPNALLDSVRVEWTQHQAGTPRDVVQMFTGHTIGSTVAGIAYSDGLCSSYYGYTIVRSRFSTTMANRIAYSAHELGHNAGARHCEYNDWQCRVMCWSIGRCSAGMASFGPFEVGQLRAFIAGRTCLAIDSVDVEHTAFPFSENFSAVTLDATRWTAADKVLPSSGRLEIDHGGSWGGDPEFWLGTVRTRPVVLTGTADVSYKARSYGVPLGQHLWVEYYNTRARAWLKLDDIVSPGGTPADYISYAHTLPDSARGDLFALRFSAYGSSGSSTAHWYLDDVAMAETPLAVGEPSFASVRLLPIAPNPAGSRARLVFELAGARPVRLAVYDVRGMRVRTLVAGTRGAGRHEAVWDGRDERGSPVASGLYWVRLEAGDARQARPVVMLH
jgi:hypothetical protein